MNTHLLLLIFLLIAVCSFVPWDSRGSGYYRVRCWIERAWGRYNTDAEGFERFDTALIATILGIGFVSAVSYGIAVYSLGGT